MTELTYDLRLERYRLEAHNNRSAAKYAILCDLSGVDGAEENEDLYLRGVAELQTTPGLADTLHDEFGPKRYHSKKDPKKLTKKDLFSLPLSTLVHIYKGLVGAHGTFDPGYGCRTDKARKKAFADIIYNHFH